MIAFRHLWLPLAGLLKMPADGEKVERMAAPISTRMVPGMEVTRVVVRC